MDKAVVDGTSKDLNDLALFLSHLQNQKNLLRVKKMYFTLVYCGEIGFENIEINVSNIVEIFNLSSDILKYLNQDIFLFMFVDGTLIDENDYLQTLPEWTPLIVCPSNQKEKILIYFDVKRAFTAICQ